MKGLRFIAFVIILCALVASVGSAAQEKAKPNPLQSEPLVLTPPASVAPQGSWSYVPARGYLWMPVATAGMAEAEWAPWDPWWIMPYGQWAWAEGYGWGWTPMIPYHSMSPLGWGFDSWYGGWYGFTPDGNPSNTFWEYGADTTDKERAQAWVNGHGGAYKGHDPEARVHAKVKINTVVAAPPPSLAPPEWRASRTIDKVQDAMADQGKGFAQNRDRGDRQHGDRPGKGGGHGKSQGPGKLQGGGGRVEPGRGSAPPMGGFGGGMSAGGRSGGSDQPKKH
jgi:hypothetical protein